MEDAVITDEALRNKTIIFNNNDGRCGRFSVKHVDNYNLKNGYLKQPNIDMIKCDHTFNINRQLQNFT